MQRQTSTFRYAVKAANNKQVTRNAVNSAAVNDAPTSAKSWRDIPGPSSLPIIGPLHNFLPGGQYYKRDNDQLMKQFEESYGPLVRLDGLFGNEPLILTYDPECTAQILRGENWFPVRPGFVTLEHYRINYVKKYKEQPTGLITDHGDVWKKFRSTVNPVMLQPKTIKLYKSQIDEVSRDMIQRLKSLRGEDNMLKCKFDEEINLWALESIGVVALGDRLNCFDPNLPADSPARKLIQVVHDFFEVAEKLDFKPSIWKYYATPTYKKAMKVYEEMDILTRYFVNEAVKKLKQETKKSDDEKGVLEKLLEIDENVAYIMASDMLFAGVDTTGNTMIYTLYMLAKNPEKQEKLREEVLAKNDKNPYLRACIKEAIRCMPVVSGNLRRTTKEYNLMGYHIPKDMLVTFAHEKMSLMETQYHKATEFIPERWLAAKDDPLYHGNAHPFAHQPFGFGVRMCIGRRIAELEIETFLTRIIENFKVEWAGDEPLKQKHVALTYAVAPFNFVFKDV